MNSIAQGLMCLSCNGIDLCLADDLVLCRSCNFVYPVVNGIPVMINEDHSVFRFADFVGRRNLFFEIDTRGLRNRRLGRFVPDLENHTTTCRNFRNLRTRLSREFDRPRVLVLGGSIEGVGISELLNDKRLDIVESDVSFGPRTQIILDAHEIPYAPFSFDCVIVQAVLEHVLDPFLCVKEIHRVLRYGGLIYAETPFMQQVHGRQFDFTRFTHSGHRRLFRCFEEIASGMTAGPGSAAAWSYQYLLLSLFGHSVESQLCMKAFARLTGFWLKYLDILASRNPRSIDAACGLYFMGRRSADCLKENDIINYYSLNC